MAFVTKYLVDKAVYWAPLESGGDGQPTYDDPVEISCRWREETQQMVGRDGTEWTSQIMVVVDRDVEEQGVLWLGTFSELEDAGDPFGNEDAWRIQKFKKTSDLRGTDFVRRAFL